MDTLAIPTTRKRGTARPSAEGPAKACAKRGVASAGCVLNALFGERSQGRFGILMYHRFADPVAGLAPPTWNVTPAAFRKQLTGLLDRGFRAWRLARLIEARERGDAIPSKIFAVTIDDAHESVYRCAWPILRELQVPATLFVPTAYIDSREPFPFDGWSGAGLDVAPRVTWQPMSSEQCLEVARDGLIELGAHTHTHQDFRGRPEAFRDDLTQNVEILGSRFGVTRPQFAFPYGRATRSMMEVVRDLGLRCGLTTAGVLVEGRESPFGWGRFNVEPWDTAATSAARLNGWCSWATQARRRFFANRAPELI